MSEFERAWAAGFFDGEGSSCQWRQFGIPKRVQMQINQASSPELLYRFARAVGVGRVNGPYKGKSERHAPQWYWMAYREDAWIAMRAMWPYLGDIKKRQFIRAARDRYDTRPYPARSAA